MCPLIRPLTSSEAVISGGGLSCCETWRHRSTAAFAQHHNNPTVKKRCIWAVTFCAPSSVLRIEMNPFAAILVQDMRASILVQLHFEGESIDN
jgi:hypothetical protein